jgi:hypothetical protein
MPSSRTQESIAWQFVYKIREIMKKQILAALITAASMGSASAAVVFSDNFESYGPVAGNVTITGGTLNTPTVGGPWTVTGSVDLSPNPGYGAITMLSLDNAGTPGSTDGISTSINTIAGATYTLTFDYTRNWGNAGALPTTSMSNLIFGSVTDNLTSISPPYVAAPIIYGQTYSYVASSSGPITLSFMSPFSNDSYGITLDNIVVTETLVAAIPEPGEWAMMLSGLAVVGAIARRRRVRT